MSKKLIQSDGTEFEQNGKDMAIIDTRSRGGIPIMINADEFNEAYANADSETKAMIHAGGQTEEVDPIFSASPAAGITADDITSWGSKLSSETDPVFTASVAYGISSTDIETWNGKSDFSGNYEDLNGKPTIPTVPTDISAFNNDSGYLTSESDPVFSASAAAGISSTDISNWNLAIPLTGLKDGSASGSLRGANTAQEEDDPSDPDYYIMGSSAIAVGSSTKATGNSAIAAGPGGAVASGTGAVAIGYGATASGSGAFALGSSANASGNEAFALGTGSTASGSSSLALGTGTNANGTGGTMAVGASSSTSATSFSSVALGLSNSVTGSAQGCAAIGYGASATGTGSTAFNHSASSGTYAHSEGTSTASGDYSHAEGQSCTASGTNAHAEGQGCEADSPNSHAEGTYTIAHTEQHVQGTYNIAKQLPIVHIVGNGSLSARSNAHTLDLSGNAWYAGDVYVGSTSGTDKDSGSVKLLHSDVIAPEYDSTSTYALGAYVMHDNKLYECTTAIAQAENWTAAHWTQRTLADLLGTIRSSLANI